MCLTRGVLVTFLLVALSSDANAATVVPGFAQEVFAQGSPLTYALDAAFGPGGAFGSDLFIVGHGEDRVVTVSSAGDIQPYAPAGNGPWGLAFSNGGPFGQYIYLNCEDIPDGIARIDPTTHTVETDLLFHNEGTAIAISDGGAFGQYIYSGQALGADLDNVIYRVDSGFNATTFVNFGPWGYIYDMAFSNGGALGEHLFATIRQGDDVHLVRITAQAGVEVMSNQPFPLETAFLAISPGGVWGNGVYVSSSTGSIWRVGLDGEVTEFASGLYQPTGLAFSPDGSGLFIVQSDSPDLVLRIQPVSADINGDGVVGVGDLGILAGFWGLPGTIADINGDGVVAVGDLAIMAANWTAAGGGSTLVGSAIVPVPGAGVAGLALIGTMRIFRRKRMA